MIWREVEFGGDGDYSEDRFINIVNAHLANSIGNLLNRTLGLLKKNCQSTLVIDSSIAAEGTTFKDTVEKLVIFSSNFEHHHDFQVYKLVEFLNVEGGSGLQAMEAFLQDLVIILEAMRVIAIALSPVTPSLSWRIYRQLGYSKDQFDAATWSDTRWGGLKGGQVMAQPQPIFARIESQTEGENRVEAPKKVQKEQVTGVSRGG
ncbi:putative methionine--tRNA ligase [Rosa chinensis]|uniref:Putative methionine--tRNA ligase n=1 Tax=Rosa chinensis TaxID=74649 RepID=A0A2P6REC1_ROSCH|nr:putative methionine--tRNA ligase [Rosa chinensis]